MELVATLAGVKKIDFVSFGNVLQLGNAVIFDAFE